jgi:hypothetical protein
MKNNNNKIVAGIIAVFFIVHLVLIFNLNYTTDAGDSITHYLYSRWSFRHPENFVNHWAKPLFVLLSAPFAQFGFEGICIFNLLVYTGVLIYTHLFCRRIGIVYSCIPVTLVSAFVFSNQIIHSGLTEPLGCLVMIAGFYFLSSKKYLAGTIIMSFAPFVRSEGLILCGTVGLFFLLLRDLKWIPLLITGHLVFGLIGWVFFHKTFLWVITEIPYANGNGGYGTGPWDHFIHYMPRTIGTLSSFLWKLGLVFLLLWPFLKKKPVEMDVFQKKVFWVLVVSCFVFFFGFHAVSWAKGLFNSFGLLRVMVVVFPQLAIIAALPLLYLMKVLEDYRVGGWAVYVITAFILLSNFTDREWGFRNKKQFSLDRSQQAEKRAYDYIRQHYPDYKTRNYVYSASYMAMLFGLDYFDKKQSQNFMDYAKTPQDIPGGSILIWDNWFSVMENGVPFDKVGSDPAVKMVAEFKETDEEGEARIVVFEKTK